MKRVIIIRYAEIYLKGKNRGFFERAFEKNLRAAIKGFQHELIKQSGRYIVQNFEEEETDVIVEKLQKVFGLHTLSVAYETSSELSDIFETAKLILRPSGTFKVETHRGDKKYPLTSVEISRKLGAMILDYAKGALSVDVHNPSFAVRVDIRERG
ncbi:MAG: tRNA 4-thiouridine(8) synthase ThiI, partial [Clostridia bacterium]|nr:tRNA 4-thiouridine(8) synthase ThiI [Clostridia bacterium]